MKKLALILLTVFSVANAIHGQNYGWTDISTNIPDTLNYDLWGLSDVYFVSDNEGWISVSSDAIILHTTDGGETFEIQTTQTSLEAIYMINQSEGYTGGGSGFVYKTSNGGANWDFFGSMASTLTDMDFATSSQGYACGDGGAVFSITADGVENLNSGQASYFSGISAPSVDNVWICGGGAILYYNGSSFTFQSGPAGSYNTIFFINDTEGWVGGDSGITGHTEDGGASWTQQYSPTSNSLYDVFFLDNNFGWAVGFNGIILSTTNGGETWIVEGADLTTNFLRGVHFTSTTNGYVAGNQKTLLKYTEISGIGDEVESLKFEIFPNPTANKIQIKCFEFKTESGIIEILSLDGKKILEKKIEAGIDNIELDLNNLKSGMYFCKICTNEKSSTKKLIIE